MNKRFALIIFVFVALFVGLFIINGKEDTKDSDSQGATTSSHIQGGADAKVTLVEFGDFQCPACAGYFPIVQELKAKYGDQIKFQFSHFPIVGIHPNAMSAHRAAEAASKQDKFWEMHDLLYSSQESWSSNSNPAAIFEQYAEQLGLDVAKFKLDVADPATKAVIDADVAAGKSINVAGTPTFVLNGKIIDNTPRDVAGFSALIDEILDIPASQ